MKQETAKQENVWGELLEVGEGLISQTVFSNERWLNVDLLHEIARPGNHVAVKEVNTGYLISVYKDKELKNFMFGTSGEVWAKVVKDALEMFHDVSKAKNSVNQSLNKKIRSHEV